MLNLYRLFSTFPVLLGGLPNNLIPTDRIRSPIAGLVFNIGDPLPEAQYYHIENYPSIHASNFLEQLWELVTKLLASQENPRFNLMIEAVIPGNLARRTVGHSFNIHPGTTLQELESLINPWIDKFEAQSGSADGQETFETVIRVLNISSAPNPTAIPFTSDPTNVEWSSETKGSQKSEARTASTKRAPSLAALSSQMTSMNTTMNTGFTSMNTTLNTLPQAIAQAMKASPAPSPNLVGINWGPIIQGIISGVASSLGASVTFPTPNPIPGTPTQPVTPTPSSPLETRLNALELQMTTFATTLDQRISALDSTLTSTVSELASSQAQLTSTVSDLASTLQSFIKASTPSSGSNGPASSTPPSNPSSPPTTPSPLKIPPILPEITASRIY